MACCTKVPVNPVDAAASRKIEADIKNERRKLEYEVKLLLLGAGESGKSTFAKQMKILHMSGFDEAERAGYKSVIHRNIAELFKSHALIMLELDDVSPKIKELAERIQKDQKDGLFPGEITAETAAEFKLLWADGAFRRAEQRSNEYQLGNPNFGYFMDNLDRIIQPDYIPNDQDILRSRSQTCGVVETRFTVANISFRMCDVAGQRSERRKWMHCFSDVKAVIILVGLSEYDQTLAEQNEINRMHEALKLFGDICNSRWFEKTTMILFLNKADLMEEKLGRVPLNVCFPDYKGDNTFEDAINYIAAQFKAANSNPSKLISMHVTCATDTEAVRAIFAAVKETILRDRLADSGL